MFDLNRQIERWKRAFAEKRTCSSDELQELESHLREEIVTLTAAGLSEQEAFCESVSRLGDSDAICSEFAKNEKRLLWDCVAIRASSVLVGLVGLAAVALGFTVSMQRQDGLLGAHLGSIIIAYVVPFLLAAVGTYAIFRAAIVKSSDMQFRRRFAGHCRFLLGAIAIGCAAGAILGGFWAERHLGRFWGWDLKEIGALSVVVCALVLYVLVTRRNPSTVHLGQASLIMSLVTFVAWFGPAVYTQALGVTALALLAVALIAQLSILGISLFLMGSPLLVSEDGP